MSPKKYSLTIQGHSTSLTLEPIFWQALNEAAASDGKSLAALVAEIDEARTTNLSSAVRVWLFERARGGGAGQGGNGRMIGNARVAAAWSRRNLLQAGLAVAAGMAAPALAAEAAAGDLAGLSRKVRGRFLTSDAPGYDDARRVWNKVYDRRPLAMARCADVDDVRRCVEFARRHALPVAIRGGGHSYAGWGVADGALQVDLGALDRVTIDAQRRIASVGGGTRIRQLLAASYAQG